MDIEKKLNDREEIKITNTHAIGFSKDDMMGLLKILIPAVTVLLIAAGAYKNNRYYPTTYSELKIANKI